MQLSSQKEEFIIFCVLFFNSIPIPCVFHFDSCHVLFLSVVIFHLIILLLLFPIIPYQPFFTAS